MASGEQTVFYSLNANRALWASQLRRLGTVFNIAVAIVLTALSSSFSKDASAVALRPGDILVADRNAFGGTGGIIHIDPATGNWDYVEPFAATNGGTGPSLGGLAGLSGCTDLAFPGGDDEDSDTDGGILVEGGGGGGVASPSVFLAKSEKLLANSTGIFRRCDESVAGRLGSIKNISQKGGCPVPARPTRGAFSFSLWRTRPSAWRGFPLWNLLRRFLEYY